MEILYIFINGNSILFINNFSSILSFNYFININKWKIIQRNGD